MTSLDRVFGWLMVVGALLHGMGSYAAYKTDGMELLWAESATLAELLLAALNLLRVERPNDRALAWVCVAGGTAQLVMDLAFGRLIGNVLDVRVVIQGLIALVLLALSVRTAMLASEERGARI